MKTSGTCGVRLATPVTEEPRWTPAAASCSPPQADSAFEGCAAAIVADELPTHTSHHLATSWVKQQRERTGGEVLLLYPTDRQRGRHRLLAALEASPDVVVTTWRSFDSVAWAGGPVLAAWPDAHALSRVHADRRAQAVCVLPWRLSEVAAWAQTTQATILGERSRRAPGPDITALRLPSSHAATPC